MKKVYYVILLMFLTLFITSCKKAISPRKLDCPTELSINIDEKILHWKSVDYAQNYTIDINGNLIIATNNQYSLQFLTDGEYSISVQANGDEIAYLSSIFCSPIQYIKTSSIEKNPDQENLPTLAIPSEFCIDNNMILSWKSIENAVGYTIRIDNQEEVVNNNCYSLQSLIDGEHLISIKSNSDGIAYQSSAFSEQMKYTKNQKVPSTEEGSYGSFIDISTRESYLGYGIDIINSSAITSKNVKMAYPIFNTDKLLNERLLKSNEHYNHFETLEASTIEEFNEKLSNSTSITSGSSVAAKGQILDVTAHATVSLSKGLTTKFTKTSSEVESQYFLQISLENQSYWLILQSPESRYKELLSEEFKADLYNYSITPAQLFDKYGTHLLTSVAMGGNISMYYTMYSYEETTTKNMFVEISNNLKTGIEFSYGDSSISGGSEDSFKNAFEYSNLAKKYNIVVDKKIISAGGGSFGITTEESLINNYYDWQKSLDEHPVLIGVKDSTSLYPIWNLLDMNKEGAQQRYEELFHYFQTYGAESYQNLCENYGITIPIYPNDITNIRVGTKEYYNEQQIIQASAGDILNITFDVSPENATKYLKTYSLDDTTYANIDDRGCLTINKYTPSWTYITITISAGMISKRITLCIKQTYNVTFNTCVNGFIVSPILGVEEGCCIAPPKIERPGYVLVGWYKDLNLEEEFNFETEYITSDLILYAKWRVYNPDEDGEKIYHYVKYDLNMQLENGEQLKYNAIVLDVNGNSALEKQVIYGHNTSLDVAIAGKYYTFVGWFTTPNSDGIMVVNKDGRTCENIVGYTSSTGKWIIEEDIKLYAHWIKVDIYSDYIYIKNASDLYQIDGTKKYLLISDIDLGSKDWKPIEVFNGVLDGDGHIISHLTIGDSIEDSEFRFGFCAINKGIIQNVTFKDVDINIYKYRDGIINLYVGTICGTNDGGSIIDVSIINSSIMAIHYREVDKPSSEVKVQVGGIAGNITNGEINNARVYGSSICGKADMGKHDGTAYANVGGIVGELTNKGMISFCLVSGDINNNNIITAITRGTASNNSIFVSDQALLLSRVGSIAGYMSGEATRIDNCFEFYNTLFSEKQEAGKDGLRKKSEAVSGAIVGRADSGLISNCGYSGNEVKAKGNCRISSCEFVDTSKGITFNTPFDRFKNCVWYNLIFDIYHLKKIQE